MKFVDSAKIYIKAGNGGNGCVSFRREKYIEFGGPDGGDGGDGANIYLEAKSALNTLLDFRYKQHFKGATGKSGAGRNRSGEKGQDLIIQVPVGTIIFNEDKTEILFEMLEDGKKVLLAKGGRGGKGNHFFKSATNQAPRYAQSGERTEEFWIRLELEILADIGLLGLPNAGKSTLINALTNAKSKVANYAFTTLYPNLGVLQFSDKQIVIADLPGLVAGANEGVGLGTRFLSHVKRTKAFLHVIDVTHENLVSDYQVIVNELNKFQSSLLQKPTIIILNKIDLLNNAELTSKIDELTKVLPKDIPIISISAVQSTNLQSIIQAISMVYYELENHSNQAWNPLHQ